MVLLGRFFPLHAVEERVHSMLIWIATSVFPVLFGFELKSATAKIIIRLRGGKSILLLKKYVTVFANSSKCLTSLVSFQNTMFII